MYRFLRRHKGLFCGQVPLFDHTPQDVFPPLDGQVEILQRGVLIGRLR